MVKRINLLGTNLLVAVSTPPSKIRKEAWSIILGNNHIFKTRQLLFPEITKEFKFDLIITDEAQNLKFKTEMYKAIRNLNKDNLWLLTGTQLRILKVI